MTEICKVNDIPEVEENARPDFNLVTDETPNSYETEIEINGQEKAIFLLKHEGEIKAYINSCPHTGAKLNWQPGRFLDIEKQYIQCTIHGALFEKDTGLCVHGPCINQSLSHLNIRIENNKVYLSR